MRPVFLTFFVFLFASCFNQGDCLITATNLVKISLLNTTDRKPRTVTFTKVEDTLNHFDFIAPGADTTVTSLRLPLDPQRLRASYLLVTSDSVTYNLDLNYTTYTRIIALDCGAFLYYQHLSVEATNFYNVKVITPQLLTSVSTNLEIFF